MDARGNRHSFTYDSTAAQTQLIEPVNRRTTLAYDAAGQQNLRIDARSNCATYAYSTVGQLNSRKYPNGTRATFSYDTTRKIVETLNPVSAEIRRKLAPENRIRSIISRSDCLICRYGIDCDSC